MSIIHWHALHEYEVRGTTIQLALGEMHLKRTNMPPSLLRKVRIRDAKLNALNNCYIALNFIIILRDIFLVRHTYSLALDIHNICTKTFLQLFIFKKENSKAKFSWNPECQQSVQSSGHAPRQTHKHVNLQRHIAQHIDHFKT